MTDQPLPNSFSALVYGFKLLSHPKIRAFVIVPILINFVIFGGLFYWGWGVMSALQLIVEGWLPVWLDFLSYLIWPVFILLSLLIMAYGFTTLTNIIAAPFNSLLSEKVEELLGLPSAEGPEGVSGFIQSIPRTIIREFQKLLSNLKWMLLLLILMLIPGVNILSFLIGAWMLAIEYLDFPADNHQMGFKQYKKQVGTNKFSAFTFGLSIALFSMIPIVNFLVVPASICASTALWHKDFHPKTKA